MDAVAATRDRQFFLWATVAWKSRGYHNSGTVMARPSRNATLRESLVNLTFATHSSAISAKMPMPSLQKVRRKRRQKVRGKKGKKAKDKRAEWLLARGGFFGFDADRGEDALEFVGLLEQYRTHFTRAVAGYEQQPQPLACLAGHLEGDRELAQQIGPTLTGLRFFDIRTDRRFRPKNQPRQRPRGVVASRALLAKPHDLQRRLKLRSTMSDVFRPSSISPFAFLSPFLPFAFPLLLHLVSLQTAFVMPGMAHG